MRQRDRTNPERGSRVNVSRVISGYFTVPLPFCLKESSIWIVQLPRWNIHALFLEGRSCWIENADLQDWFEEIKDIDWQNDSLRQEIECLCIQMKQYREAARLFCFLKRSLLCQEGYRGLRERRNASVVLQTFVCIVFKDTFAQTHMLLFWHGTHWRIEYLGQGKDFSYWFFPVLWLQKTLIIALKSHGLLYRAFFCGGKSGNSIQVFW